MGFFKSHFSSLLLSTCFQKRLLHRVSHHFINFCVPGPQMFPKTFILLLTFNVAFPLHNSRKTSCLWRIFSVFYFFRIFLQTDTKVCNSIGKRHSFPNSYHIVHWGEQKSPRLCSYNVYCSCGIWTYQLKMLCFGLH